LTAPYVLRTVISPKRFILTVFFTLTVEQGDVFDVRETLEFGDGRTLDAGDVVTVANISKYPDDVHFEFSVDGDPGRIETIFQFALELNLENEYMEQRE